MTDNTKPPGGRGADRAPLPPINFAALADALLAQADTLVPDWLPGGVMRGSEWKCASLSGGEGHSCSVSITKGKWGDFAAGQEGKDLISLYAAIHDLSMGKAALKVAQDYGLEDVAGVQRERSGALSPPAPPRPPPPSPAAPKREPEGWQTVSPVPTHAAKPNFNHEYRKDETIEHCAEYRVGDVLYGYVVRFRTSDGGKTTIPYTWSLSTLQGFSKWVWRGWDDMRPLYLPGHALPTASEPDADGVFTPARTVILVEGERKADVLQGALDVAAPGIYVVASWVGGVNGWKKAEWSWLTGCTVLMWPDCDAHHVKLTPAERKSVSAGITDKVALKLALAVAQQAKPLMPEHKQPGTEAMHGIGTLLRDAHACTVQLLPIPTVGTVASGWDCADAIEVEGWDGEALLALFGRAQPLPAAGVDAVADAGGKGGGKKPPAEKTREASANAPDGDDDAEPDQLPWWLRPYWDAEKSRWLTSRKLVIAALRNDSALEPLLGINKLSNNIEARSRWPWPHSEAGPITSAIDLLLGQYLTDSYGLPSITRQALSEAVETVAHMRPFHPFREYLEGLEHDGRSRIDDWLVYAIGETPESLAPPVLEYLKLVGRYWLLGMVNRVMEPGCKFDYCPVLEGPGGVGKSTMVEILAGSAFYSDTHFDVSRGKEGQEQVQGLVLYEIAELANFGKAEIGLIKAFITAKVDRYRPSYGRTVESYPRQCVLVGTTNESTYLRDRTGNRRFWPIPVRKRIELTWLKERRDQLLAEAFALYRAGTPFTPSHQDEERLFVPMQESRLVETAVISEMTNILTRAPLPSGIGMFVNELCEFVTMAQLTLALGVDAAKSNAALEGQIRGWLDHEGWPRVKRQVNGVRAWGYCRPANWPQRDADDADGAAVPSKTNIEQGEEDAPF